MNSALATKLKRLSQHDGEWVLEVERMFPQGDALYQPTEQKVHGAHSIAKLMQALPELTPMAEATQQLMEEEPQSYELWQGAWLEAEMVHILSATSAKAAANLPVHKSPRHQAQSKIQQHAPTDATVKKLQATIEALEAKVRALSAAQENGEDSQEEKEVPTEEMPIPNEEVSIEKPARPFKRINLPSLIAVRHSLSTLLGKEITLVERKEHHPLCEEPLFHVLVQDDEGTLVGIMIADMEATVRLSCTLLMLPEDEITEQLANAVASDDSQETMSEIFNTLSSVVNNVKNNPHIRTSPLDEFTLEDFSWVQSTKRRLDLNVESGGFISICAV